MTGKPVRKILAVAREIRQDLMNIFHTEVFVRINLAVESEERKRKTENFERSRKERIRKRGRMTSFSNDVWDEDDSSSGKWGIASKDKERKATSSDSYF